MVNLSGDLHSIFWVTFSGNNLHIRTLFQPQGISGVGSVTGSKYLATGVTRMDTNVDGLGFPFNTTFVNNFRIIGQGPGNNFLVQLPNPRVTITFDPATQSTTSGYLHSVLKLLTIAVTVPAAFTVIWTVSCVVKDEIMLLIGTLIEVISEDLCCADAPEVDCCDL